MVGERGAEARPRSRALPSHGESAQIFPSTTALLPPARFPRKPAPSLSLAFPLSLSLSLCSLPPSSHPQLQLPDPQEGARVELENCKSFFFWLEPLHPPARPPPTPSVQRKVSTLHSSQDHLTAHVAVSEARWKWRSTESELYMSGQV